MVFTLGCHSAEYPIGLHVFSAKQMWRYFDSTNENYSTYTLPSLVGAKFNLR